MHDQYKLLFGTSPKYYASPLEENEHPELDESEQTKSNSISDNIHSTQITSLEFIIGMACILTCSITYSLVSVLTQKLKEIHFSLMMFHYGWVASSMILIYLIVEHIS